MLLTRARANARLLLVASTLILAQAACGGEPERTPSGSLARVDAGGYPIDVSDDSGVHHRFERAPTRIVSLVPSATQTLLALGAGDRLVGRTEYDSFEVLSTLPSVGGGLQPNLEVLISLNPDLVIRFEGQSDRATANRLSDLGITHFAVKPDGVSDVLTIIDRLGSITDARSAADSILTEIQRALDDVTRRVEGRPRRQVVYMMGGEPPWVVGPGTYIDELMTLGGAVNVFHDLGGLYGPISLEEVISRDVDLVLTSEGAHAQGIGDVEQAVVPSWVEVPGPTLGDAAATIARLIHPEAFR